MTRKNFGSLSKSAKKSILLKSGAYLAERKLGPFRIMLYQVADFYTEVFFFEWSKNAIGFRSFHSTNKLSPYLQKIDVSEVMQELMH